MNNACVTAWLHIAQVVTMFPSEHRRSLVRPDAGSLVITFLMALKPWALPYIILARLPQLRTAVLHRIADTDWRPVARCIAVVDMTATVPAWHGQHRRFVASARHSRSGRTPVGGG